MQRFKETTIKAIVDSVDELMRDNQKKIDSTFQNTLGPMTLTFKAKLTPLVQAQKNDVKVSITFIAEKVQAEVKGQVEY